MPLSNPLDMKLKDPLWAILIILALGTTSVTLFNQSTSYRLINRHLILKNDSLMSVTIELAGQLDSIKHNTSTSGKVSGARSK